MKQLFTLITYVTKYKNGDGGGSLPHKTLSSLKGSNKVAKKAGCVAVTVALCLRWNDRPKLTGCRRGNRGRICMVKVLRTAILWPSVYIPAGVLTLER